MTGMPAPRQVLSWLTAVVAGLTGMACSAALDGDPAVAGLTCLDDSKQCIEQRSAELNAIMSDKQRRWIREQPTPAAYASGVRLFAYKTRKRELSCEELMLGQREADGAPVILRGPGAAQLTPAQVSRGMMLGAEVSRELASEIKRRCRV